jgi:SlyX protein
MSSAGRLTRHALRGNAARALSLRLCKGYTGNMTDTTQLEEQIAYLTRTVDELSDIVARQETELALVTRRLAMLMEREAGRELDAGGSVPLADQRPPHY